MSLSKKPKIILDGDITIVDFGEELRHLGEDVMPAVSRVVHDAGEAPVPKVLLDLKYVQFFGSSFIEVLFRLWQQMETRGGLFVICGLHPYCLEVLQVTNLDKLWTICPDREAGLTFLRTDVPKSTTAPKQ
jgi:anti-sigma B factor antagonist